MTTWVIHHLTDTIVASDLHDPDDHHTHRLGAGDRGHVV
jgi:hypothetical protein